MFGRAKGQDEKIVKPKKEREGRTEQQKDTKGTTAPVALKASKVAWHVLQKPRVTEKSTDLTKMNQYTFQVFAQVTKPQVKQAIEEVYGVKVERVRRVSVPGKKRRRGRQIGWRSGYTKAIVTLRKGDSIEVLPH
jgi:large subunit ribosomal protein L23